MRQRETCASILVKNFEHWGVNHIFGIPGKAISPIIYATEKYDVNFILSKHETGAGFSAAGYSLMNQKFGVTLGTSGPGGTNLLTAAGQANASNVPILIITGHPGTKDTGKAMGQDSSIFGTDLVEMFKPVTKFSARVERADQLQLFLQHALEKALTGVKGPVHLSIAFDILLEEIDSFTLDLPEPNQVISHNLYQVVDKLNQAKRPLLFLGKGVHSSRAYDAVRLLAENWNIPVMTTPGGKGTFPTNHTLSLGGFGLGGTKEASDYLREGVDILLVMGTKLSDMSTAGFTKEMYPDHLIHFDYEATFIGKSIQVPTMAIFGDLKANLDFILRNVPETDSSRFFLSKKQLEIPMQDNGERMSAGATLKVLRNTLPDDAIIFGDDGSHTFYGIKDYDIYEPGSFFFDDIFGAMGHGIGYAIGAKAGNPDKNIVCLTGDGCMFMHGTEISTALNYHIPVLFIVLNNGQLDMVEKGMQKMNGKSIGAIYETPLDVALFAESMGVPSFQCHDFAQLMESIQHAMIIMKDEGKPVVVEVIVDNNEIPPTMGRQ